jgi:hypothetical protein
LRRAVRGSWARIWMWSSAGRRGRSWASLVVGEDEVEAQVSWLGGCDVEVILFDGSLGEIVGFDRALSGEIGADMMSVGVMKCDVYFALENALALELFE